MLDPGTPTPHTLGPSGLGAHFLLSPRYIPQGRGKGRLSRRTSTPGSPEAGSPEAEPPDRTRRQLRSLDSGGESEPLKHPRWPPAGGYLLYHFPGHLGGT